MHTGFYSENLKGTDRFGDLRAVGRISRRFLWKYNVRVWINLAEDGNRWWDRASIIMKFRVP
jgi:hypothetical protein